MKNSVLFMWLYGLALAWSLPISQLDKPFRPPPVLILLSFDGFRQDYLDPILTPFMHQFSKKGVIAKKMKPMYITKTLPNHFSIVTGLWEESHGIVHNLFYDPLFKEKFFSNKTDRKWWDNGRAFPIWTANELVRDGNRRCSGSLMWPGSTSYIANHVSCYKLKEDSEVPFKDRVDIILDWINRDEDPANMVAAYFHEPDMTAHSYGPFSKEVKNVLSEVDKVVEYLVLNLDNLGLLESTNIMIVSDHGMAETNRDRVVIMDDFIDPSLYDFYGSSPNIGIHPKPGKKDIVYTILQRASPFYHFRVYEKDNIPQEYHYRNHRRIQPIIIEMDEGYEIIQKPSDKWEIPGYSWGVHGYNNSLESMRPLFIGVGPAFKQNFVLKEEFENVDLYPLMQKILSLPLAEKGSIDGSLEVVGSMLNDVNYIEDKQAFNDYEQNLNKVDILKEFM